MLNPFRFFRNMDAKLDRILRNTIHIKSNEESEMHNLDEVLAALAAQKSQIAGIGTIIGGLKEALAKALTNVNIPEAVQAKIDAVFDTASQNSAELASALNTNTPAANIDPAATA